MLSVSIQHCSANFADDQSTVHDLTSLTITCNVSYVGNLQPSFQCQPSAVRQPQQFFDTNFDVGVSTGDCSHVIRVTRALDGTLLTCTMHFVHHNHQPQNVTPPTYNFTWFSDPLVVTCKSVAFFIVVLWYIYNLVD